MPRCALLILLPLLAVIAEGASLPRQCRRACKSTISRCVGSNPRRRPKCKKHILRRCKAEGLPACTLNVTTTTTVPPGQSTTTTTTIGTGSTTTLPSTTEPFVTLAIDAVYPYVKSGTTYLLLSVTLASHNGADHLSGDLDNFTLFPMPYSGYAADDYETYNWPNPCSAAVKVPVNGSTSCDIVFPIAPDSGGLEYDSDRAINGIPEFTAYATF